jgi:hypothetical protein
VVQERERGTCSHVTPASLSAQLGDSQATTSLWRAARPRNRNLQTSTRPLTARLSTQRGRDDHRSPPEPIDPAGALLSPVDNRAWVKNTVPCRWTQQVVQYSSHLRQSSVHAVGDARRRGGHDATTTGRETDNQGKQSSAQEPSSKTSASGTGSLEASERTRTAAALGRDTTPFPAAGPSLPALGVRDS